MSICLVRNSGARSLRHTSSSDAPRLVLLPSRARSRLRQLGQKTSVRRAPASVAAAPSAYNNESQALSVATNPP